MGLPFLTPCLVEPVFGSQPSEQKKILVLASYHPAAPVGDLWHKGIRSVLDSGTPVSASIDIEYLDVLRFSDKQYTHLLFNLLHHKYKLSPPDLVIALYSTALEFILTHGNELFPGVPVIFAGVEEQFIKNRQLGPTITGLTSAPRYTDTLALALDLHPDTQSVAVVSGAGIIGRTWGSIAMQAFRPLSSQVNIIDLTGLPMPVILEKVANLPQRSLIMYITLLEDGAGNKFLGTQSAFQISRIANAPVYSFWDVMLGHGIVGGYLSSTEKAGKTLGTLAFRLLNGERPADIPVAKEGPLNAVFDWRELIRWSIAEDRLPPGSLVKFKQLSPWDEYKGRIITTLLVIVFQGLVIAYLLYLRGVRRQAEQDLVERLTFEKMVSQLSSDFIRLSADQIDSKIRQSLAQVGSLLKADRAFVFRFNWEKTRFAISHMWESEGTVPDQVVRGAIVKEFVPWVYDTLISGQEIVVPDTGKLVEYNALREYEYCRQTGIRSFLILPVQVADAPLCAIGLDAIRSQRSWSADVRDRLRLIGEIFANAIERQHSEKRIRAAEWKFKTMADYTYDWEYWQRTDGSLVYVSPSCERISGYSPSQFTSDPKLIEKIIVPEDQGLWKEHQCAIKNQTEVRELIQFRIVGHDGDMRWIEHACQPVFDEKGEALGVRVSNRDITQRELLRSESQQLQSDLAHVERVVTISAMTSALAHEINQPLAAIRSYAQAALRFMDAEVPDLVNVRRALEGIVADNKRASAVVNRLRDLVKKKTVQKEILSINQMIDEVIMLINSELVMRNTTIETDLDPSSPIIYGDPIQIQQVVMNLLTNAMDAMEDVPIGERSIKIHSRVDADNKIRVSIVDHGKGIAPEQLKNIFLPFCTTKPKGLGLGLAISKSIINAHGGSISAENNSRGGATFVVILPMAGMPSDQQIESGGKDATI